MKYQTTIRIWSDIGNTPITNRDGAYCDELLNIIVQCETPEEAFDLTKKLISETNHGFSGHFAMPSHPNQNTRNRFVR